MICENTPRLKNGTGLQSPPADNVLGKMTGKG
ncbi:hypothetical protein KL86CLO1_12154 [uncultured Eubacteriales bacterium]|uniref:Uncharacterized protein n=1 Tax=uncultured Eubacteriales bacterium TaxID=172733 RepID=A0A212K3T9_9FIRM|nr:hypothetical protein KL86CLO1_12154 [uncultured Eubacteriales bacterium]